MLMVENVGNGPISGDIILTDGLPISLTYVSATGPGWDCTASTLNDVACTHPGPLLPQSPALVITLVVQVSSAGGSVIVNSATVSSVSNPSVWASSNDTVHKGPLMVPLMSPQGVVLLIVALFTVALFTLRSINGSC